MYNQLEPLVPTFLLPSLLPLMPAWVGVRKCVCVEGRRSEIDSP